LEVLLRLHSTEEVGMEGQLTPIRSSVEKIIIHHRYSSRLDYDAALIKLNDPVDITLMPPVCLPKVTELENPFVGINATVLGWGLIHEGLRDLHDISI
jgi:hypothetical protein